MLWIGVGIGAAFVLLLIVRLVAGPGEAMVAQTPVRGARRSTAEPSAGRRQLDAEAARSRDVVARAEGEEAVTGASLDRAARERRVRAALTAPLPADAKGLARGTERGTVRLTDPAPPPSQAAWHAKQADASGLRAPASVALAFPREADEPEGTEVGVLPPEYDSRAVRTDLDDLHREARRIGRGDGHGQDGAAASLSLSSLTSPTSSPSSPVPASPPFVDSAAFESEDPTGPIALILVTAVGRTDAGRRRKHNEDSYLVLEDQSLFVIADGMGGYAAGEVASQLAVEVIAEAFTAGVFRGEVDTRRPRRGDELVRAIEMANYAILSQARSNDAQSGMGTTLVACRFSPNKQRVYIAHVGDSRCYRIRGGVIQQMTKDHTLGAVGIKGPAAAKLSRAVGIAETVEVDVTSAIACPGDHYLLCSDGLSKMVPDEQIHALIVGEVNLELTVQRLIEVANDLGGRDNITVILIHVEEPQALVAGVEARPAPVA